MPQTPRYAFGLVATRILPLTDDLKIPVPTRLVGGPGTFDFSGVADPSAAILYVKEDTDATVTVLVDVSGAVDTAAVTATELAAAIDAAMTVAVLEYDCAVNSDGRVQITHSGSVAPDYTQLAGEVCRIARFGQGYDLTFLVSDTFRTMNLSPTMREQQTFSTIDANGIETEVITDGYRKGLTGTLTDTADRLDLKALVEGGTLNATTEEYEAPTSESQKPYFLIESFYAKYAQGTNKRRDLIGYAQETIRTCNGMVGDVTREEGFADGNYTITATSYRDEDGNLNGDIITTPLTTAEYQLLDVLENYIDE